MDIGVPVRELVIEPLELPIPAMLPPAIAVETESDERDAGQD